MNEVRILASIDHPCIISYKQAFIDESSHSLCMVMEYADGGDLFDKISKHHQLRKYMKETEIWRIFIQVLEGLACLHQLGIMHRDLKSAKVFLFNDGRAKLGDLNVSKILKNNLSSTQTGTPYYASPEIWKDLPYGYKSDVWSLG